MTFKSSLPSAERPRERLLRQGVEALTLSELIAILLSTGTKGKNVLELARELVSRFPDLRSLLSASVEELMSVKGVGQAKALQLKAAFGIALLRDAARSESLSPRITQAQQVYHLVRHLLEEEQREVLLVVLKDVKQRLLCYEKVAIGSLSEVLSHPREIFFPAVRHKAHSLILVHNHPSGDATPSEADTLLTKQLQSAAEVMGIFLDDHIIIGKGSFFSYREKMGSLYRK